MKIACKLLEEALQRGPRKLAQDMGALSAQTQHVLDPEVAEACQTPAPTPQKPRELVLLLLSWVAIRRRLLGRSMISSVLSVDARRRSKWGHGIREAAERARALSC